MGLGGALPDKGLGTLNGLRPALPVLLLRALSYPEPNVQPLLRVHQEALGDE